MDEYLCISCGWIYNPEEGDPDNDLEPGVPFEELYDGWICPNCGDGKEAFELIEE